VGHLRAQPRRGDRVYRSVHDPEIGGSSVAVAAKKFPPRSWVLRDVSWMRFSEWDRLMRLLQGEYATLSIQADGSSQYCKGELYVSPRGLVIIAEWEEAQ
jgi:hypothetical protein